MIYFIIYGYIGVAVLATNFALKRIEQEMPSIHENIDYMTLVALTLLISMFWLPIIIYKSFEHVFKLLTGENNI